MKMQADKYMRYAGKPVNVGDVFEANASDVRILVALNRAHAYTAPPKKTASLFKPIPAVVEARIQAMVDNGTATEDQAENVRESHGSEDDRPRRAYKRRDMVAE